MSTSPQFPHETRHQALAIHNHSNCALRFKRTSNSAILGYSGKGSQSYAQPFHTQLVDKACMNAWSSFPKPFSRDQGASKVHRRHGATLDQVWAESHTMADFVLDVCCRQMIKDVQEDFGRLDILVNNAGIQHVAPVHEFPDEKWDALIAILLSSAFHTTKAALPFMLEQGWGRVINTGSMHALVASPYKSAYNAAKHGIAGTTRSCLPVVGVGVTAQALDPAL